MFEFFDALFNALFCVRSCFRHIFSIFRKRKKTNVSPFFAISVKISDKVKTFSRNFLVKDVRIPEGKDHLWNDSVRNV